LFEPFERLGYWALIPFELRISSFGFAAQLWCLCLPR
jgi:hypothetical protein